jgi:hypothetical protein
MVSILNKIMVTYLVEFDQREWDSLLTCEPDTHPALAGALIAGAKVGVEVSRTVYRSLYFADTHQHLATVNTMGVCGYCLLKRA